MITDPSYAGQIITMTYPQIGNYGVNREDCQSREAGAARARRARHVPGALQLALRACACPTSCVQNGVVAIEGVDTRALVRHVRDNGAQRAVLSTLDTDAESLLREGSRKRVYRRREPRRRRSLAPRRRPSASMTCRKPRRSRSRRPRRAKYKVVAYDCGAKLSIFQNLVRVGCELTAVPWDTPAEDVLAMNPDGVFLSNGPGDPDAVSGTYTQVEKLLGKVPIFGICLGHQMMSKAAGAQIEKLKFGHRGGNHPVMNLRTHRVEITAQNHGFGLLFPTPRRAYPRGVRQVRPSIADDLRFWVEKRVAPVVRNEKLRPHPAHACELERRHRRGHRVS